MSLVQANEQREGPLVNSGEFSVVERVRGKLFLEIDEDRKGPLGLRSRSHALRLRERARSVLRLARDEISAIRLERTSRGVSGFTFGTQPLAFDHQPSALSTAQAGARNGRETACSIPAPQAPSSAPDG